MPICVFSGTWTFMDIHGHLMTPFWEVPPQLVRAKLHGSPPNTQNAAPARGRLSPIHLVRARVGARVEGTKVVITGQGPGDPRLAAVDTRGWPGPGPARSIRSELTLHDVVILCRTLTPALSLREGEGDCQNRRRKTAPPAGRMAVSISGKMVRSRRLELPRAYRPQRPQRCASTNSATTASRLLTGRVAGMEAPGYQIGPG